MFFVRKRIALMLFMCLFQYVVPPNERIKTFGPNGPNPETMEEVPVEQAERLPPRTGGIRRPRPRSRSSTAERPTPQLSFTNQQYYNITFPNPTTINVSTSYNDQTSANSIPIGRLNLNDRYNHTVYTNPPQISTSSFPHLPIPNQAHFSFGSVLQPVISPSTHVSNSNIASHSNNPNPVFRSPALQQSTSAAAVMNPSFPCRSPAETSSDFPHFQQHFRNSVSSANVGASFVDPNLPSTSRIAPYSSSESLSTGINSSLNTVPLDPDELRRERARKRQQEYRKKQAPEAKRLRQEIDKAAKLNSRNNESQAEREIRQSNDRTAHRESRANETDEQTEERQRRDADAHQESRANKTGEQTEERQRRDANAHQESRANETEEQTEERRRRDADAHQESRANETEEQNELRRSQNAATTRRIRADMSPEREQRIREANAASHRRRREQMSTQERNDFNARRRNVYQLRMEERRNANRYIGMGDVLPEAHYIGQLNVECVQCGALFFPGEGTMGAGGDFEKCCNHGKVSVLLFHDYPTILQDLMTKVHPESSNFHSNIRQFNSSLAMASLEAELDTPPGRGPSVFRVHGQVVHNVGPAMPRVGRAPSYGQLYFIDTAQAVDERMGRNANTNCSRTLMQQLSIVMTEENVLAQSYKMLATVYHEEEARAMATNSPIPQMKLMFYKDKKKDQRRYNAPTSNEVAAVYVGPDGEVPTPRQYTVFLTHGGFQQLHTTNPKLDPLTYPLIWPTGRDSWHPGLKKSAANGGHQVRLTQCDYYSFLFSIRRSFNPIHHSGKLFQQLSVDVFIRMEQNRLEWARNNQQQIRAELYQNLEDFVEDGHGGLAGTRVILPSSHAGSARNFSKAYYDTMAMVAKYGKPDLFCTFTCNSKWPEITENLYPGQDASDRPDLVARVFVMKWKEFMHDIVEKRIFGQVISFAYTVEWQKRGLPHCHLVLTLAIGDKPDTPEKVDKLISAEIPDKNENPLLYEIVTTHMLHRKCGADDPTAPCMRDGKCSKHFPKSFCTDTNMDGNGYPEYRRRNDGRYFETGSGRHVKRLDNRHVVPYNKWLSCKYRCHVNVEATVVLRNNARNSGAPVDEITVHLDARYLCAPEALHRIFENKIQERSHSVENLQVHLPEHQRVNFVPGQEREALEQASNKHTNLIAFFELNQRWHEKEQRGEPLGPTDPRTLLYAQIPEFFTFKKVGDQYMWETRGNGGNRKIGRMYGVTLRERERFSLRQLLLKRKGPRSFDDLRTLNGHIFPSFEAAAMAMGLLNTDDSFAKTMDEACESCMPFQLRKLFASLFLFEIPHQSKALELWEKYVDDLAEDFSRRGRNAIDSAALAWYEIEDMVGLQNLELSDFIPPPLPNRPADAHADDPVDHVRIGTELRAELNPEQEHTVARILSGERLVFIDGAGGCGKTFVYQTIYHILKGQGRNVVCTAWTGIASSILPEGRTVCSLFKLNSNDDNKTSNIKPNSKEGAALREIDTIIIDEVSMLSIYNLDAIDKCLKDVCNTPESFGGKRMLLGGDFRQTLPIPSKHSGQEPFDICLKNSELFHAFTRFELTRNMRASTESVEWKEHLIGIGNGTLKEDENEQITLPEAIKSNGDLITEIYDGVYDDPEHLQARAILTCRNRRVDAINKDILALMEGTSRIYYSFDQQELDGESDQLEVSTEFMNDQTPPGFPLHALTLKKGCVVMLIRNLNIRAGLCNGTRLQITTMGRHIITATFISGARKGQQVLIPRIEISSSNKNLSFKMTRTQFPLKLAFAMTINKSQGQSLEMVGIDLEDEVFSHGMLYVALSRSKTKNGVKVLTKEGNCKARNVVDRRVLDP